MPKKPITRYIPWTKKPTTKKLVGRKVRARTSWAMGGRWHTGTIAGRKKRLGYYIVNKDGEVIGHLKYYDEVTLLPKRRKKRRR